MIEWCPQGVEAGTGTERRCKDVTERVLGSASVNIGNPSGVYLWTLLLMLSLLALIGWMSLQASRKNGEKGSSFYLLRGVDGGLSLSRSQVAAWTVAVAGVVFGHGLVRLEIPEIPDSLLVLMGLSLATGGISYAQTRGAAQPERPQRHFGTLGSDLRQRKGRYGYPVYRQSADADMDGDRIVSVHHQIDTGRGGLGSALGNGHADGLKSSRLSQPYRHTVEPVIEISA